MGPPVPPGHIGGQAEPTATGQGEQSWGQHFCTLILSRFASLHAPQHTSLGAVTHVPQAPRRTDAAHCSFRVQTLNLDAVLVPISRTFQAVSNPDELESTEIECKHLGTVPPSPVWAAQGAAGAWRMPWLHVASWAGMATTRSVRFWGEPQCEELLQWLVMQLKCFY